MTPEQSLREKLRKIEALFAGAATEGEKVAAGAAAERIRDRLGQAAGKEKEIEAKFSISDVWSRQHCHGNFVSQQLINYQMDSGCVARGIPNTE